MHYIEPATGSTYPLDAPRWCADNGGYLNLGSAPGIKRADIDRESYSVWRYARALLVPKRAAVSLGEGWTPLVTRGWDGIPVLMKLEFMMPTGSFKDRGMTVMVSHLKSLGVASVLEDSSGNAGASLAAYAAAAGLRCRILVPETASYPKIAQIAACGADVVTIPGSRQDVADEATRQSAELFYASHNWQPFFVEGTKTLAYEVWEQSDFRAPDNLVVPLGYGSNVLGAGRGFAELVRNGEIARRPRLFGVQAAGCAPFSAAFHESVEHLVPTPVKPTMAEGIATPKPTRVAEVLRAVRETGGTVLAVEEGEIAEALRGLARLGLYVEPTSAVAAAGLTRLLDAGVIRPQEYSVLVLTGSGLKASATVGEVLKLGARSA